MSPLPKPRNKSTEYSQTQNPWSAVVYAHRWHRVAPF